MCHLHSILLLTRWLLVFCVIGGLSFPAGAATEIIVTTSDDIVNETDSVISLREAVSSAISGDTIGFDPALASQTITLSEQISISESVTINGNGVTISGGNLYRVFEINNSAAEVGMNNLKIVNGHANYGSGIYNSGELSLNHCTLTGNTSTDVSWGGGAIKNLNILSVKNSTISTNDATVGLGGGILNFGSTVVENSTFNANNATQGGGIYNSDGSDLTITNSTFSGNSVTLQGGGIFNAGSAGSVTTKNSTFSENHADDQGGGIYNDGTLTIVNSIVSANSVNSGGSGPEIFNGTYNGGYTFSPSGNNVFGFDGGVGITTNTDIFAGGCHCVTPTTDSIADIIGDLTNNGGPTQTRAPVFGGLAHNAGDNTVIGGLEYDQRGGRRILNGQVDIGAVEVGTVPLNDTGIQFCGDYLSGNNSPCLDTEPVGQDVNYGRDAEATDGTLTKIGGGAAGFDYTKIANDGSNLAASATLGIASSDWACTRDNVTGLMWEVKTDDGGLRDKDNTYIFSNTNNYVSNVNAAGLCGYYDWRMPTVKELMGITNLNFYNPPAIDTDYFPNTSNTWFWSFRYAHISYYAWGVFFGYGDATGNHMATEFRVRLVRGVHSVDTFIDNGDGTVSQTNTALMWAKCSEGQTDNGTECVGTAMEKSWSAALTAANDSLLADYSDWRLPNVKELQALADHNVYYPAINNNYFPNTPIAYFWSSSPHAYYLNEAWFVHFDTGYVRHKVRSNNYKVRLVRGGLSFDTFALTVNKIGTGTGTVTSNGDFINCGAICSYPFFDTTRVTLTAMPNTGSTFTGWSGGGCSGTGTCTVTMSDAKNITANFTITQRTLSISKVGNGRVFTDDIAIDCGATCSNTFNYGTIVTLKTSSDAGYVFTSWNVCTGSGNCVVAMDANKNVTATFTLNTYSITATANPVAGGTINCTPNPVTHGSTSNCTATPNAGYVFTNFTGACTGTTCALTNVTANKTVTANFTLNTYSITATANPTAGGSVTCSPNPVNYNGTANCTVTPNAGYTFSNFSDDCSGATCALTNVTANKTVTANFTLNTYSITATANPTAGGSVTCSPNPVNYNGTANCTVTPNAGYTFSNFSDDCSGTTCALTNVTAAKAVTAHFVTSGTTYSITTTANPVAGGTVNCTTNPVPVGGTSTCSATTNSGYTFVGFSGDCSGATCSFTNVTTNKTITAKFLPVGHLNDTGIQFCGDYPGGNNNPCLGTEPAGQDKHYGRDAEAAAGTLTKVGGGAAGFDFTAIDASGNTTTPTSGANPHPCVLDNVTGLMWEVKTDDNGLRDQAHTYTFDEAASYVNAVNDLNLCGFSDWRMPTVKELYGITHLGIFNSTIDSTYFPNTPNWLFWSGSPYANGANYAWYVYFVIGNASYDHRNGNNHVRLVRGGQSFDSFVDNGDGTVSQTNTGLMWAKCSEGQSVTDCTGTASTKTWSEALTVANNSNLGGYSDWRLPNAKELQALVDYSRFTTTIDTSYFPNTPSSWFWSGSPSAVSANYAWGVYFNNGNASNNYRYNDDHVRLVRGGQSFDTFDLIVNKTGTGSGTVTSNGSLINCGAICSYPFFNTTRVTLTATPNAGSTFTGWSGDCSGTGTCIVTMDAVKNVTATFAITQHTLSINKVGNGRVFTDDSVINCGATCSSNFDYGTIVTLKTSPDANYVFSGWDVCTGSGDCDVAMDANKNVTATFELITYLITTTANPVAGGTVNCTPNPVTHGSTSNCTATPNAGYVFTNFTGDCTGTTCALTNVTAAKAVTANFTPLYSITATANPVAGGTINCTPNPVTHGSTSNCTATPNAGYVFTNFTGACTGTTCELTNVTAAKAVTANFTPLYSITATANPVAGGTINCTPNPVTAGDSANCTATPNAGYVFTNFTGACTGTTCALTNVTAAKAVTANFTPLYSITATANPVAGGTINCTPNPVTAGDSANCIATANVGYVFTNFTGACTGTTCALTNVTAAKAVTANFTPLYSITATANPVAGGTIN
ncbi:InlB B-repeat-containing protein, partial [Chromatium okenii]|uniref:InlB B-repeat-containing protein n=1 Tax=Chromatium okenii TaxID=61644 RepID=UPI001906E927